VADHGKNGAKEGEQAAAAEVIALHGEPSSRPGRAQQSKPCWVQLCDDCSNSAESSRPIGAEPDGSNSGAKSKTCSETAERSAATRPDRALSADRLCCCARSMGAVGLISLAWRPWRRELANDRSGHDGDWKLRGLAQNGCSRR